MENQHSPGPLYTFLSPGDIMAEGDEFMQPWLAWSPIPKHNIGNAVAPKGAVRVRRPYTPPPEQTAAPKLLEALAQVLEIIDTGDYIGDSHYGTEINQWRSLIRAAKGEI